MRPIIVAAEDEDTRENLARIVEARTGREPHDEGCLGCLISEVRENRDIYRKKKGRTQKTKNDIYGLAIIDAPPWNKIPKHTTIAVKAVGVSIEVCVISLTEDSKKAVLEAGAEYFMFNDEYLEQELGKVLTGYMEKTYQGKP